MTLVALIRKLKLAHKAYGNCHVYFEVGNGSVSVVRSIISAERKGYAQPKSIILTGRDAYELIGEIEGKEKRNH